MAVLSALLLLALLAVYAGLSLGAVNLSPAELVSALISEPEGTAGNLLWKLRLPRVLAGVLAGAGLAVSGAVLQGVMRNPLASPGIIGVSAGGGLAAILILLVVPEYSLWLTPAAFLGALGTALLVYFTAWKGGIQPIRLILSGVAVSSMFSAAIAMILLLNAQHIAGVLDFTVGTLASRNWDQLAMTAPYIVLGLAAAQCLARRLNILGLGDETAESLGLNVELSRFLMLAAAALLAAASVSLAGLLGFVGLIAPHMTRLLTGSDCRSLIPGSALLGAALVVACDTAGRLVMEPLELPCGAVMALLGPPFFLYLLRSSGRISDEA